MDINDETEIVSTYFEAEDDVNDCVLEIQRVRQKAKTIAEKIMKSTIEINDILANCKDEETKEKEVTRINKQIAELKHDYLGVVERLSELVKSVGGQVDNLEYPKFDIDQIFRGNNVSTVARYHDVNNESFCSCNGESGENACDDSVENCMTEKCSEVSEKLNTEYENEAVRDELMATIGEVKLLHEQNRALLSQLNATNQRTVVLSNALRNKPHFTDRQSNTKRTGDCESTETRPDNQDSKDEIEKLRNELNEMKRDRCQIELARKILNVSDSKCANCLGSTNQNDNDQNKLEELTQKLTCVSADRDNKSREIEDLRNKLNAAVNESKEVKNCLVISNERVTQLERKLFDIVSAESQHDTETARSNDKYLIENLKHRLFEAKAVIKNMEMVLDFHLSEVEDKKAKYLEVLQTHHELKNRIETLNKEKCTIAKEYEDEFNRMNDFLKTRLEEVGRLPAKLALVQKDLEQERSARMAIEEERNTLLDENKSLKASLRLANNAEKDQIIKDLEEQNKRLTATVMNLEDNLKENSQLYIERTHYALQLKDQLNAVREEAAIDVTRSKDFFECQKLKYTEYIHQLEKQLAESRAIACSEFKKRDKVNERLRNRIEILTKNLHEAELKITEVVNVKKLIENNSDEEICRVPEIFNSTCHD